MIGWLRPGPRWWATLILVVPLVVVAATNVWYVNYVQTESDARWCELLDVLHVAQEAESPESELGLRLASSIAYLRREFGC